MEVKGGEAQSRSPVVGLQGKGAINPRPHNKSLKPTAASTVYVGVVLVKGLTLAEKCEYNGGRLSYRGGVALAAWL